MIQEERQTEKDNLERSSNLLNSLLASGVAVPPEVRGLMEETERIWNKCTGKICEMEEFVNNQTPLKAQGLQENMEVRDTCNYMYECTCMNYIQCIWILYMSFSLDVPYFLEL